MSTQRIVLKAVTRPSEEIGAPGLKEWGGFLQEEFVTDLRGQRGAQKYREMVDNCPAIDAALSTLKHACIRAISDGRVEPFDGKEKGEHARRAEFVQECLDDMSHSRLDMDSEALTMCEYGFAPLEIVYKKRSGENRDEELSSRFTDGAVGWRKISLRAQESVWRWEFDLEGRRFTGMVQIPAPSYTQFTIPIDKIALFRTQAVKGNPEGRSLLRAAYFAWHFFKRGTTIGWVGAERDVTGIPVLTAPGEIFSGTPTTDQSNTLARLKQIGENVRNDEQACVLLPSDVNADTKNPLYTFSLVSSPGGKILDVPAMTRDQERQILMVLFSDFLLMGHEKIGTQALFSGRVGVYAMQLDALLDRYDEVLNRQLIPRLGRMNGWSVGELPHFKHGTVTQTVVDELAKFLGAYTSAGGVLDPELDAYVREAVGWPEPSPGTMIETEKPEEEEEEEEEEEVEEEEVEKRHDTRQRGGKFAPSSGDIVNALSLLRDRQRVGGGDSIDHGFEIATEWPFDTGEDYRDEVDGASVERVPLSSLRATQPSVRRDRVRDFLDSPGLVPDGKRSLGGVLEDLPVVFETEDGRYINDGHHRLAAAKLLGVTEARVRVVRPAEVEKMNPYHAADGKFATSGAGARGSSGAGAEGSSGAGAGAEGSSGAGAGLVPELDRIEMPDHTLELLKSVMAQNERAQQAATEQNRLLMEVVKAIASREPQSVTHVVNIPKELEMPTPQVTVNTPDVTVNVPETVVNVNVPEASVVVQMEAQPAPQIVVNVPEQPAPMVSVAAPVVNISTPPADVDVKVTLEQGPREKTVEYDGLGQIKKVTDKPL